MINLSEEKKDKIKKCVGIIKAEEIFDILQEASDVGRSYEYHGEIKPMYVGRAKKRKEF